MSARCPEGHDSEALDYCDVCGSPMGAAPVATDPPSAPVGSADPALQPTEQGHSAASAGTGSEAATQTCPHCGALNVADALFCEACGYDFTTGTPPMSESESGESGEGNEGGDEPTPETGTGAGAGAASDRVTDEAAEADLPSAPVSSPEPGLEATEQGHSAELTDPDPTPDPPVVPAHPKARHTPPSRALAEAWVVELWVDPDWYAVQQTEEACPSAGVPDIVLLTRSTALIGRPSGSLGVRPEVDAGADSAVSRRHAQLTSDGQRWWVEDLGSSNGTFVGTVGEPLPTAPVPPGQRVEIDRDDRLYVGAWTRIVLRQATDSESRGTG